MKLKKAALAAVLAMSAVAAVAYPITWTYYTDVEYYTDASYSTMVGEVVTTCTGAKYTWGTLTAYKRTVEKYSCGGPIP